MLRNAQRCGEAEGMTKRRIVVELLLLLVEHGDTRWRYWRSVCGALLDELAHRPRPRRQA